MTKTRSTEPNTQRVVVVLSTYHRVSLTVQTVSDLFQGAETRKVQMRKITLSLHDLEHIQTMAGQKISHLTHWIQILSHGKKNALFYSPGWFGW